MNFNLTPKENPRNSFLEHCVNEGNNFEVEIVHWHMVDDEEKIKQLDLGWLGNQCWNVYATIKQSHPLFDKMKNVQTDDYSSAMDNFPFDFHGGITYIHNNGDNIKVGDDYMHCDNRECHDGEHFCNQAMKDNSFYKNARLYKGLEVIQRPTYEELEKENAELQDKLKNLASVAEVRLANWQKYEKGE